MEEKQGRLLFKLFFVGLLLIIVGNYLDYYFADSVIGGLVTGIGFIVWIIAIIYRYRLEKKHEK